MDGVLFGDIGVFREFVWVREAVWCVNCTQTKSGAIGCCLGCVGENVSKILAFEIGIVLG